MSVDYETQDFGAVVTALEAGAFTADSTGFLGILEDFPEPPPEPSQPPTIFALWDLLSVENIDTMAGDPIREYAAVFEIYRQHGSGDGHTHTLAAEIRTALDDGPTGMQFLTKRGQLTKVGTIGSYRVDQFSIPTFGGVA